MFDVKSMGTNQVVAKKDVNDVVGRMTTHKCVDVNCLLKRPKKQIQQRPNGCLGVRCERKKN